MARKLRVSIPRIALTPAEAAAALGVGPDFFDANVAPELRFIAGRFGDHVAHCRKRADLSQEALSQLASLHRTEVS